MNFNKYVKDGRLSVHDMWLQANIEKLTSFLQEDKSITELFLRVCNIGSEDAEALANSENLKNLTKLDLSSNKIGKEGAEALANSENLENLTTLNLSSNKIGNEGAEALANSENLKKLTTLNLNWNKIGKKGAEALANSKNLKNLTTLNLGWNEIGKEGAEALANSENLKNLTTLNLGWNEIGNEGAKALTKALNDGKFPKLTMVLIRCTDISDNIIKQLYDALKSNVKRSEQKNIDNKNKMLVFAVATIAISPALVAHFIFQASLLVTGTILLVTGTIAGIGACCLVVAAATYCFNKPSNSLENSDVEVVNNKGHAVA